VCGELNGACFGYARSHRVCWPPSCADNQLSDCGKPGRTCGKNCACVTSCDAEDPKSKCPSGEVCQLDLGYALEGWARDACGDPRCATNDPTLCGDRHAVCGDCVCTRDCSQATCEDPSDGCGGTCAAVCQPYQACPAGVGCTDGYQCFTNLDPATCLPVACSLVTLEPPVCGTPDAECGATCPP
jgi:hypothetical protein